MNTVPVGPPVEVQRYELWPVIAPNALGCSALGANASQRFNDLRCFEPVVDLNCHTLAAKDIDYGQKLILEPSARTSCMKSIAQL